MQHKIPLFLEPKCSIRLSCLEAKTHPVMHIADIFHQPVQPKINHENVNHLFHGLPFRHGSIFSEPQSATLRHHTPIKSALLAGIGRRLYRYPPAWAKQQQSFLPGFTSIPLASAIIPVGLSTVCPCGCLSSRPAKMPLSGLNI